MGKPAKKKPPETPKRPSVDWEAIEKEYRAGQLSNVRIANHYGISETAIRKKAKKENWEKDLAEKVKKMVREKLVRDAVRTCNAKLSEPEIIEQAAERGMEIIKLHRKDINNLKNLETSLINELQNKPTKLYLAQFQGQIIEKEVGLTASERSMAANNLANVQHKRIALERQAYNLDDKNNLDDLIEKIQLEFV